MNYRFKSIVLSIVALVTIPAQAVEWPKIPAFKMPVLASVKPSIEGVKKAGKVAGYTSLVIAGLYVVAQLACGNSLSEIASFFIEGLKHPVEIGTFSPCSKYLGRALCAHMPASSATGHLYLEAGAGTGIVSDEILARMGIKDRLVLSEYVPQLAQILRKKYAKEIAAGRVIVVEGDVCEYNSPEMFDYIFTTIPFNAFDVGTTKAIWDYFLRSLKQNGGISYVNYRFFPELRLKMEPKKKAEKLRGVMDFLNSLHARYGNGFTNVNRNVPPIRVRYFNFAQPEKVQLASSLA